MKTLSLAGLVLLIALRSVFCAETNHDFGKWEKEISAYEASDKTNPPPKGALLFIGSSTVRMWKTLPQDFPKAKVINRGFGGSQIVDSTHFAERVIFPYKPSKVFLRAGGISAAVRGKVVVGCVFTSAQHETPLRRAKKKFGQQYWLNHRRTIGRNHLEPPCSFAQN